MRAALLCLALALACRKDAPTADPEPTTDAKPKTGPGDRDAGPQPLDCKVQPCPSFTEEVARQCSYPGTKVRRATVGRFTVLHAETDPTSVVYTSSEYFFDRTGTLVGRKIFVNEWSRFTQEGVIPTGERVRETDPCATKP